ncbi:MAG: hypothetical protein M5U12_00885 [Verrucomicrobia bacterium]|nr:hypothetical protein [Verrucomicrobiota bacterium]
MSATQAGLIYCAEPVFTSLLVLFLPAGLARLAGVPYENELVTGRLVVGGGADPARQPVARALAAARTERGGEGPDAVARLDRGAPGG